MNPLLLNENARQRGRKKKTQETQLEPAGEPIDTLLDRQAAQDSPNTGIVRRRIEMLREAQLLQRQLADSYDA